MDSTAIMGAVTFGVALLGAVLGVINLWWMLRKDTVRLKVRRMFAYGIQSTWRTVGVEVINVGFLPVTVTEVGFTTRGRGAKRAPIVGDHLRQQALPKRMESRTDLTIYADPSALTDERIKKMTHVYAKTACGLTFKTRNKGR
jgi:hypothetical protein